MQSIFTTIPRKYDIISNASTIEFPAYSNSFYLLERKILALQLKILGSFTPVQTFHKLARAGQNNRPSDDTKALKKHPKIWTVTLLTWKVSSLGSPSRSCPSCSAVWGLPDRFKCKPILMHSWFFMVCIAHCTDVDLSLIFSKVNRLFYSWTKILHVRCLCWRITTWPGRRSRLFLFISNEYQIL